MAETHQVPQQLIDQFKAAFPDSRELILWLERSDIEEAEGLLDLFGEFTPEQNTVLDSWFTFLERTGY